MHKREGPNVVPCIITQLVIFAAQSKHKKEHNQKQEYLKKKKHAVQPKYPKQTVISSILHTTQTLRSSQKPLNMASFHKFFQIPWSFEQAYVSVATKA